FIKDDETLEGFPVVGSNVDLTGRDLRGIVGEQRRGLLPHQRHIARISLLGAIPDLRFIAGYGWPDHVALFGCRLRYCPSDIVVGTGSWLARMRDLEQPHPEEQPAGLRLDYRGVVSAAWWTRARCLLPSMRGGYSALIETLAALAPQDEVLSKR